MPAEALDVTQQQLVTKAIMLFKKADNFGKGLTARQINIRPPATDEQLREAFTRYATNGFDLELLVDEMEYEASINC